MDILRPGRHQVAGRPSRVEICTFSLMRPEFVSEYVDALIKERPDLAAEHLTEVRTGDAEVAVIFRDGRLYAIQGPDGRSVFLTDAGPFEVERFDVSETLELPKALGRRLGRLATSEHIKRFNVAGHSEGSCSTLTACSNGFSSRALTPSSMWAARSTCVPSMCGVRHSMSLVRKMLTKDRVTIRVNVTAEYRVTDPVKAVTAVTDFEEALYRGASVSPSASRSAPRRSMRSLATRCPSTLRPPKRCAARWPNRYRGRRDRAERRDPAG